MSQFEKIPPQNLEAEQSLLGCLLIDQDCVIQVADRLQIEDFYKDSHQKIYNSILELFEKREPIDILSLGNKLEEKKILKQIGGRAYLVELSNTVPTSANAVNYSDIVQKKATLRRLIQAATKITSLGYDQDSDTDITLDEAERELFKVSEKFNKNTFVPINTILFDAFDRIDDLHKHKGKLRGIPTGFKDIDSLLAGFQKSDLIVLAARPSVGKTSFALDIARLIGVNDNAPVGLFSLEMSKEQLVDRMICAQSGVDLWKMRTGRLSDQSNDFKKIGDALGQLSEAPIFIDDSPQLNIMQLRTKARRLKTEHGLGLIIIDYLQLMDGRSRKSSDNRVQEVSEISRGLKQIAKELNVPVLALAQLSRAVESIKPSIPRLSHLRDSGSIEQDADVVMFIYRKSADKNYRSEELADEEKNIAEIHIAKHRNGPTGLVRLFFESKRASFKTLSHKFSVKPQSDDSFAPLASVQSEQNTPPPIDPDPSSVKHST